MLHRKLLVVAGILLTSLRAWSQAPPNRIVSAIDRGDYAFIPPEAFQPDIAGIILPEKASYKAVKDEIPLTFFWFSACTDGRYAVVVTPEQIYFRTGHENPNRNHLYWVLASTKAQYQAIKRSVTSQAPPRFRNVSDKHNPGLLFKSKASVLTNFPSDCSEQQWKTYCSSEVRKQLGTIFQLLNSPFAKPVFRRPPDTPRLVSYLREELLDWLPQPAPKK